MDLHYELNSIWKVLTPWSKRLETDGKNKIDTMGNIGDEIKMIQEIQILR